MTYANGLVPYSVVSVVLASGTDENGYWEFRCTPAFAARWAFAKREAERRFGRTIYIRTGWNIYRPLDSQKVARTNACGAGNCNAAAYPGSSSHGGEWQGRPCLAVDVDPNGLSWDQVDQAMEGAGFSARLITEAMSGIPGGERWHYIDFNAFGAVPAFNGATPLEEDDMANSDEILGSVRETYNRQEQINKRREEMFKTDLATLASVRETYNRQEQINAREEQRHAETLTMIAALQEAVKVASGGQLSPEGMQKIADAAQTAAHAGAESAVAAAHEAEMAQLRAIAQEQLDARDRDIAALKAELEARGAVS